MSNHLPTTYQEYIHLSRYSRWLEDEGRRETWPETVSRYYDFFEEHLESQHGFKLNGERKELEEATLNLEVMPSMRSIMTAGPALKRDNIAGYNCSYVAIDRITAFDEILYILMNGTGVGFSVERQHVQQLPVVADEFHPSDTIIKVADSRTGWAKSLKELIANLYAGMVPKWDVSNVRPAGAVLKTFGGRSSGPDPLVDLFKFTVDIFKKAAGRKLSSIECHDLVCKIAEIVVVGGVRRSALISLSNLSDDRMRAAKAGQWWENEAQRALSNNSACYTEKPDIGVFMDEWKSLYDSKSGERAYSTESQPKCKPEGSVEETLTMILEQIHALKSSFETMSSVISQKLSSDQQTQKMTYTERLDWPRSWVHGNPHLQTSDTSQSSGKRIVKRKGYSESL